MVALRLFCLAAFFGLFTPAELTGDWRCDAEDYWPQWRGPLANGTADGTTVVVNSGDVPRLLSLNHLSEPISASAAIAGRQVFLRGEKHLYCLAEEEK